jgi:phosphoserine phosphatase
MALSGFTPEVQRRLEAFLKRASPPGSVATFDLDGTCEHHDTGEAVFYTMVREGLFDLEALRDSPEVWAPFAHHPQVPDPRRALLRRIESPSAQPEFERAMVHAYWQLLEKAGRPTAYLWAGQVLCGLTPERVREISATTIERETARPLGAERLEVAPGVVLEIAAGLRTYAPMVELLDRLRAAGVEIWFISATNRWTVEVYAGRFLNVPPEHIVAITPLVVDGRITARTDPNVPITGGPGKVEAIERFIRRRPVLAAGDSVSDWEMLCQASALRLVIDKGNRELRERVAGRRAAGEEQWVVQPRFIDPR